VTVGIGALVAGTSHLLFVVGDLPAVLLAVASAGASGIASIVGATMLSELVPEQRGAAIGFNTFSGAILGTMVVSVLGGFAADRFGLAAPLVMALRCRLVLVLLVTGVPETAPRLLGRRAGAARPPAVTCGGPLALVADHAGQSPHPNGDNCMYVVSSSRTGLLQEVLQKPGRASILSSI
jgi:MFS family permease